MTNGVFTVGDSGKFTFEYLFDGSWYQGELGVYNLAEMEEFVPGSVEYIEEASKRALSNSNDGYIVMSDRQEGAKYASKLHWETDFNNGEHLGIKNFEMKAGDKFGFILVQDSSIKELAQNPKVYKEWGKHPLFSIAEANPDYTGEAPVQFTSLNGYGTYGFEGVRIDDGGDRDYNEVVFQVMGAEAEATYYGEVRNPIKNFLLSEVGKEIKEYTKNNVLDDGYLTVDESGTVEIDFIYDGGWYEGEVGIFSIEGMDSLESGSKEFIQEAATRAISNSEKGYILYQDKVEGALYNGDFAWEPDYNDQDYQGKKTVKLLPGGKYALMLVPNTILEDVANNPTLEEKEGLRPFFSMRKHNLGDATQVIEHAEGTDEIEVLGFEDQNIITGEGDRDYNDIILTVKGASFYAPEYEEERDPKFEITYAPVAKDDSEVTYKDTPITISIEDLLSNDYDLDGDSFKLDNFNFDSTKGFVSVEDGKLIYTPNDRFDELGTGESEIDTITYTIVDANGKTAIGTLNIEVKGFNEDSNENNVGTLDTLHYLPPLYAKQEVGEHFLVLSTTEENPFEITIQNADGANGVEGGMDRSVTVSKDSPLIVDLSSAPFASGIGYASLGVMENSQVGLVDTVEGLILNADQPFYANVRHKTKAQGLSLSSKGQLALGNEFYSGHMVTNTKKEGRKTHFISVMASEDNTKVSFPDLPEGVTFVNSHPGEVILDRYESFVVGFDIQDNKENPNALQGSLVVSDKPIVVNSGSWLGGVVGSSRDIGVDQIVPSNLVGSKYILVKGDATSNADVLERPIIIATEDNTEVFLRGETTSIATLSKGEELILSGDEYPDSDALLIETSKSAYVYQMTSANNNTAPGMSLVLPLSEKSSSQEIIIPEIDLLGKGKLNIVAKKTANVTVNGNAIKGGVALEGDSDYQVYQMPNLRGNITVNSDESIVVSSTTKSGNRGSASYWSGLPVGFAFDDNVATTANVPVTIDVLGNDLTGSGFAPVGISDLPENGTALINEDDTITYTPDPGFTGTDTFVYRGINDNDKTDTAMVIVNIDRDLIEVTTGEDTLTRMDLSTAFVDSDLVTTQNTKDVFKFDTIDRTSASIVSSSLDNELVNFVSDNSMEIMQDNHLDLAIFEDASGF